MREPARHGASWLRLAAMFGLLLTLSGFGYAASPAPREEAWFPLGRSELAPRSQAHRDSWRDAAVAWDATAMDAALDRRGRVWVATIEAGGDDVEPAETEGGAGVSHRLMVRVWNGAAWESLPELPLPGTWGHTLSLTTDRSDHPAVAWGVDVEQPSTRAIGGWSRWTGATWAGGPLPELSERTGSVGIVLVDDQVRVFRWLGHEDEAGARIAVLDAPGGSWVEHPVPYGRLFETPSVAGRRVWAALGLDGLAWSGPEAVVGRAPPRREHPALLDTGRGWTWLVAPHDRWPANAARSGSRTWLLRGHAHLVGVHYGDEVNRLRLRRRLLAGWIPSTRGTLQTPLTFFDDIRLLPTPTPTLVFMSELGRVDVLRWSGADSWGLAGTPAPTGELSSPDRAAGGPVFKGDQLLWRERGEDGDRLRASRWTGAAWTRPTTALLPGGPWLAGLDTGFYRHFVRVSGTWDRLWGFSEGPPPRQRIRWDGLSAKELPPLTVQHPVVGGCGVGDARACNEATDVELPDGSLLVALNPAEPLDDFGPFEDVPPRDWEIHRFTEGRWTLDGTVPGSFWGTAWLQGGDPASLVLRESREDTRVYVRGREGWQEVASPGPVPEPVGVGLGGTRVLMTWIAEPDGPWGPEEGGRPAAAEYDGTRWVPRMDGLPAHVSGARVLVSGPDGNTPWLAWTDAGNVFLRRWTGATWEELDGSGSGGGVSNTSSEATQPAIGFLDGNVCVAWTEAADQEPVVNVRCHVLPRVHLEEHVP